MSYEWWIAWKKGTCFLKWKCHPNSFYMPFQLWKCHQKLFSLYFHKWKCHPKPFYMPFQLWKGHQKLFSLYFHKWKCHPNSFYMPFQLWKCLPEASNIYFPKWKGHLKTQRRSNTFWPPLNSELWTLNSKLNRGDELLNRNHRIWCLHECLPHQESFVPMLL